MPQLPATKPVYSQWERWPGVLQPPVVAVVRYRINPADYPQLTSLLTPEETDRANRFRQLADKQRFVAGRGLLRLLTGQLTATPPQQIQLRTGRFGKPELINTDASAAVWHVNVSHAGEWVLIAIGHVPVGIDVEWVNPNWPYQDLIPDSFNADDQALLANSINPRLLFYTFWTRKESLLKATGQGLTNDLTAFSSSKQVHEVMNAQSGEAARWEVSSFPVAEEYVGAVACLAPQPVVRFFSVDAVPHYKCGTA